LEKETSTGERQQKEEEIFRCRSKKREKREKKGESRITEPARGYNLRKAKKGVFLLHGGKKKRSISPVKGEVHRNREMSTHIAWREKKKERKEKTPSI